MGTFEDLGDRCKAFEMSEAGRRAMPGIPLLVRLDGRAFHTYTRGLQRPYDSRFMNLMLMTAGRLVEDLHAAVAYTQSDEITLAWYVPSDSPSEYPFGGRFQKITSVFAGLASAQFAILAQKLIPERANALPHFDCRAWQVPTLSDTVEVFLWREADAVKNSVSMAASAYYSHRQLDGRNTAEKHEMLHARGVNWNDYPTHFKRGTYQQRRTVERELTDEEREVIPEAHRPAPGTLVKRSRVTELELPPLARIANAEGVLFRGETPVSR